MRHRQSQEEVNPTLSEIFNANDRAPEPDAYG